MWTVSQKLAATAAFLLEKAHLEAGRIFSRKHALGPQL